MKDSWYLWVSTMLWAGSVVSGHPCIIDKQGWAVCSGKSLLHVPDSLPRHITNLDLSFNALTMPRNGTFLRSFPSLHVLNLSSNIIPTLYPALFRNLKFLHLLDLSNCSMSYMHPNSFLGLRNLHTLLLKNNKLQFLHTSLLPVPRALVHLDLQNNQFSHIDELALLLVQRIHHVKLQGNPWMYNSSLTPFQPERQPREADQILHDTNPELQIQDIKTLNAQSLSYRRKHRVPRAEPSASPAVQGNETSTEPPPGKIGYSWVYLAAFVLLAIAISIAIALVAKCKRHQRNRASYQHHRLPDSRSIGSSHAEDIPSWREAEMDVAAYGRNQPIPGAGGCHTTEDDDGFIEDNYIEPNRDLQKEEEEDELEPHFRP